LTIVDKVGDSRQVWVNNLTLRNKIVELQFCNIKRTLVLNSNCYKFKTKMFSLQFNFVSISIKVMEFFGRDKLFLRKYLWGEVHQLLTTVDKGDQKLHKDCFVNYGRFLNRLQFSFHSRVYSIFSYTSSTFILYNNDKNKYYKIRKVKFPKTFKVVFNL